ncbi:MAG: DUF3857 domain-containing protein [Phycisphaerae bacterium]|nr:DUF3857 domain-containing protein [Phycisphaerae bacterium]
MRVYPRILLIGITVAMGWVVPTRAADDAEGAFWPATAECADRVLQQELAASATADDWARRAWTLSRYRSDHPAAAGAAAKALAIDPDHYKANEIAGLVAQMGGDYDAAFEHYLRLLGHDKPESELYVAKTDNLNLSREQNDRLLKRLRQAADDPTLNALYRSRLAWCIAGMLADRGRLDEARAEYQKLDFVTDWMVIGPFANEENAGYNKVYGPETEIDYNKMYQGRDRKVGWARLRHVDPTGAIDFDAVMYPNTRVLAYALTFVHADADTDAVVRFGAGQTVKLWINDRLLLEDDEEVGFVFDQYAAPCRLKAGWNKVLVKVCERSSVWKLALRFSTPDGRPLSMRTDAKEDEVLTIRETPDAAGPADFDYVRGAHDFYERQHREAPDDPVAAYYLAQAETLTDRDMRAVATFEKLVALNGECSDHYALLAKAYLADGRPEKALVAMKKALKLEPNHLECLIELGQFYDNSNLFEKALATLRRAAELNPDWPDAQYYLMGLYSDKGWEEHVWRQAEWLLDKKPDTVWVLDAYANRCGERGFNQRAKECYEKVLTQDYGDLSARQALIRLATDQLRLDDALGQYAILLQTRPLSISLRLAKARLLMQYERYDEALAECEDALEICGENSAVHRLIGDIHQRRHEDDKALAAWNTALKYDPDDKWMREYLEFLEPETIAAFDEYGVGEEEAEQIIENRVDPADYPKADAAVLLDHLVTQLNEDGSYTSLNHQIVQILNDSGREEYTSMPTGGYDAKVKRAVVIQPDGSEVEASRVSGYQVKFGQLQIGSIIEMKAQWRGSSNEWLSRHYTQTFRFQGTSPMLRSQFVLLVPKSRSIRHQVQGDRAKLTPGEFEGQVVYDWRADDVPMVEPERNRPPFSDIVDLVAVSTIEDWDEIAQWEYSLIKDQFVADDSVRRKAHELTDGLTARKDKIRAIANFVAQKIQYRQDYDRSIMGMKPHKAGNVLEKQVGDCKDQANLLITLLGEAGISAKYVGLRTRDDGRLRVEIPSNQCNHAIVYVPSEDDFNTGIWIDPTSNYGGIDTLPWQDQGIDAIVFREGAEIVFMRSPVDPASDSVDERRYDVYLAEDGSARIRIVWESHGQFATGMRRYFEAEGLRRQRLEQLANSIYAGSRVTSFEFSDLENRDVPVIIEFEFDAPNVGQVSGDQMVLRPKDVLRLTQQYANRTERTYDIWNRFTRTQRSVETYHPPKGYHLGTAPEPASLETEWMEYDIQTTEDGEAVQIRREFALKAIEIPRTAYDEVRAFCVEADRHQREPLILVRPDP